jgi:hypothetical protein
MAVKQFRVDGFDEIELKGVGHLIIEQGAVESLEVEAGEDVLEKIDAGVEFGRLKLGFEHSWLEFWKVANYRDTKFRVGIKNIKHIVLSGAGDIMTNKLVTDALKVELNGSGNVKLMAETKKFEARIAGSGDIVASGKADEQKIEIDGSGNHSAAELVSKSVSITVRGSGSAELQVSDFLSVSIMGIGTVRYKGSPQLSQQIFGSGRIERL